MKIYVKILICVILSALIGVGGFACKISDDLAGAPGTGDFYEALNTPNTPDKADVLEIFIFNIGKADAILITTKNHTILIDAGENEHGARIAEYLLINGIREIDYFIITHFDKDHIGGADTVISAMDVKELIVPDYRKESKHYDRFNKAAERAGLDRIVLKETLTFTMDDAIFTVYPSRLKYQEFKSFAEDDEDEDEVDEYDEYDGINENESAIKENDFSLVVAVAFGNNNFLFTGDAMYDRLGEILLIEEIVEKEYVFLKAPHHGRHNKRSAEFINAIKPKYAAITCSLKDTPNKKVLAALEEVGARVYLTSNGNIYGISDGHDFSMDYY